MNAIREALSQGKLTFGELKNKTGLSKRGLYSNLKKLYEAGEIKRWSGERDRRERYHALTDFGWRMYMRQMVSQTLKRVEQTTLRDIMDIIIENMADMLLVATKVTEMGGGFGKETLPQLTSFEKAIFEGCLKGRLYALNAKNEPTSYFESLREFLVMTKMVAAKKDIDLNLLKGLSDIVFEFRFSGDMLIKIYESIKKGQLIETSEIIKKMKQSSKKISYNFVDQ